MMRDRLLRFGVLVLWLALLGWMVVATLCVLRMALGHYVDWCAELADDMAGPAPLPFGGPAHA